MHPHFLPCIAIITFGTLGEKVLLKKFDMQPHMWERSTAATANNWERLENGGRFNSTHHGSLLITDLKEEDDGRYRSWCVLKRDWAYYQLIIGMFTAIIMSSYGVIIGLIVSLLLIHVCMLVSLYCPDCGLCIKVKHVTDC